eukprot:1303885-Pleurochrysis_carterae.AAC.1
MVRRARNLLRGQLILSTAALCNIRGPTASGHSVKRANPISRFLSSLASRGSSPALCSRMPKVSYLTDVEGNWEYFISSVKYAKGLRYVGLRDDGSAEIELEEVRVCALFRHGRALRQRASGPLCGSCQP